MRAVRLAGLRFAGLLAAVRVPLPLDVLRLAVVFFVTPPAEPVARLVLEPPDAAVVFLAEVRLDVELVLVPARLPVPAFRVLLR